MGYLLQADTSSASTFLTGIDLVYIIGILSTVVGGLWAFYRFRYEKKLDRFKEANDDLFNENKQKKLSAIATLSVFKQDMLFGKSTINVLLSKLYTETDYDITYAIGSALIQFSSKKELLKTINEIAGINRNFFSQTQPYKDRLKDVKKLFERVKNIQEKNYQVLESLEQIEKETDILDKRNSQYKEKFLELNEKISYDILWHQQITADTLARIIRELRNKASIPVVEFIKFLLILIIRWKVTPLSGKFPLYLYQNVFAYIQLVDFETSKCDIWRSALNVSVIADVTLNRVNIYDSSFQKAAFHNCNFNNGSIRISLFSSAGFTNVRFNNIKFDGIYFAGVSFSDCYFDNRCEGLKAANFYGATLEGIQKFPAGISLEDIKKLKVLDVFLEVLNSNLSASDKEEILYIQAGTVTSLEDILELYNSNLIDISRKESLILEAGPNFKVNTTYFEILKASIKSGTVSHLLYLLYSKKTPESLIVEIYDTPDISDKDIRYLMMLLWPQATMDDYLTYIDKSILTRSEKSLLVKRLKKMFEKTEDSIIQKENQKKQAPKK